MFIQENIEKLKRDLTDKYVVVSGDRPELRRFEGYTGQVKTVNMSGRALVQFDAWNNIGWYDIELGYLKVVPKPDPNAAKVVENRKDAAPKKVPSPEAKKAEPAKPAAKPAGGKMSVAEMLAAARANKPAGGAPAATASAAKPAEAKAKPAEAKAKPAPAAAEKKAAKPAAGGTTLPKGGRATVPQMLAYCREHDAKA